MGWFTYVGYLLYICACSWSVTSQSQQYEAVESSGGNIFMGSFANEDFLTPGKTPQDTRTDGRCTFTFVVPQAQIEGAGCGGKATKTNMNMTKMHEDIIEVESRMIARDAYTRREMKNLRDKLERERARKKLGVNGAENSVHLPDNKVDTMMGEVDKQVRNLHLMLLELRRQVRHLEEQVRSAQTSTQDEIGQFVKEGNCPPDFERFNTSCYSYFRDKRTWYKSRDFCQELGGHLVSIETESEQEFIKEYLKDKGVKRDTYWVYVGGNDLDNDKEWTWIGSNHIVRHPEFWYSDVTPPPDTGFVCMFLYLWDPNNFAKWTKDRCDFQMPSICEIPLVQEHV